MINNFNPDFQNFVFFLPSYNPIKSYFMLRNIYIFEYKEAFTYLPKLVILE